MGGSVGGLSGGLGLFGGGANSPQDKLTGGQKAANKASKKQLKEIKALFEGLNIYGEQKYGEALKSIEGVGAASKADALSKEKQYIAHTTQGLQGLGLSGSTVGSAAQRGIHSDTLRTLGTINEDVARMRAGLLTGQAGFRQSNVFNLADILGGVQHSTGTDYLAQILGIAGFGLGGGMGGR